MQIATAKPTDRNAKALACGVLVGIVLMLGATAADALSPLDRSVSLSSQQWQLVDRMTQTTVFAALGINIVRGVDAIERTRVEFAITLTGLREGNAELGLVAPMSLEVLRQIDEMEAHWRHYDATLETILSELRMLPQLDDSRIDELADSHALLTAAIDETTEAFRRSRARLTTAHSLQAATNIE